MKAAFDSPKAWASASICLPIAGVSLICKFVLSMILDSKLWSILDSKAVQNGRKKCGRLRVGFHPFACAEKFRKD